EWWGGGWVFTALAGDLVREGDRQVGELGQKERAQLELVRRVHVGVEQADRDGLDGVRSEPLDERIDARAVERELDRAVPAQALDHLDDVPPGHQPLRLAVAKRV